ncbi:hypothetical protein EXS62_00760 [Candidatus Kaiserbacteria bacterium]|nr:hypothetical protein [Candidatus Kaiserbacteria bacterium]
MQEDKSGVEELKNKLYSRGQEHMPHDIRAPLDPSDAHAPARWEDTPLPTTVRPAFSAPQERMALATKFFIGSAVFFVLATIGASVFFFTGGNYISSDNIDLQIVAPALIDGGTAAQLQFIITNHNPAQLQLADLIITYPQGTRDPKNPQKALNQERVSIGTLDSGRQQKLTSSAVFYGAEGSVQTIKASLEYSVEASNAVFTKESAVAVTLGSSPVSVSVDAPAEIIAGQPFSMTVTVQSNSQSPVQDVVVQGQYPFGFSVDSTTPHADSGGTLWRVGTMSPGVTQVLRVTGRVDGQDGDEKVFRFITGSTKDQTAGKIDVPFLSVPASLTVHRPFITGSIAIDGKSGEKLSASAGTLLQGNILWQNNLRDPVSNVELRLKFEGPMVDLASIKSSGGFYDSSTQSLVWTSAQDPSLAQVPPGGSGTLSFSFSTLAPGAGGVVYQNPTIDLTLAVKGTRTGEGSVPEAVTSGAHTQLVISSAALLTAQALHNTGPFTNAGVLPPRAESPTAYAVVWTIKNSSNTIGNATVSAVLPSYVSFVAPAPGSDITYEAASRTVRWNVGDIKPGVGYSSAAQTGSFQVILSPSVSQVGTVPALTGAAVLSGTDRFAQTAVSATALAPTTRLTEPDFVAGMDIVAPKQ